MQYENLALPVSKTYRIQISILLLISYYYIHKCSDQTLIAYL